MRFMACVAAPCAAVAPRPGLVAVGEAPLSLPALPSLELAGSPAGCSRVGFVVPHGSPWREVGGAPFCTM